MATVPRWTIIPTIQKQSVAEHSYFVGLYADWIASMVKYEGSRETLIGYGLLHDMPEIVTGDLPTPAPQSAPGWSGGGPAAGAGGAGAGSGGHRPAEYRVQHEERVALGVILAEGRQAE